MDKRELVEWQYRGEPLLEAPAGAKSFIYKITYIPTGRYYIGYKLFANKVTTKLGKKALASRVDKRSSKKKVVLKEKWREYTGSCANAEYKELWVKNPGLFKREVLQVVYKTDWSEKYYELKHMILNNWESEQCYNSNFGGKYFKKDDSKTKI